MTENNSDLFEALSRARQYIQVAVWDGMHNRLSSDGEQNAQLLSTAREDLAMVDAALDRATKETQS